MTWQLKAIRETEMDPDQGKMSQMTFLGYLSKNRRKKYFR